MNYTSPGIKPLNRYQFNGVEGQSDLGLGLMTTLFRLYDPQLGRFHQVDPLTDFCPTYSPFAFATNNPIAYSDADGLNPLSGIWRAVKDAVMGVLGFKRMGSWGAPGSHHGNNAYYVHRGRTNAPNDRVTQQSGDNSGRDRAATPRLTPATPDLILAQAEDSPAPELLGPQYRGHPLPPTGAPVSFQEDIRFEGAKTSFLDQVAKENANSLVKTLQDYPQLQVLIIANGGTGKHYENTRYGSTNDVLSGIVNINGGQGTVRELLLGRAQAIVDVLVRNGISISRIKIQAGGVFDTPEQRKATIQFTNPKLK